MAVRRHKRQAAVPEEPELPVHPADDPAWARDLAVIATETSADKLERAIFDEADVADEFADCTPWELDPDGRLARWVPQGFVAEAFSMSVRHVRRLEETGLPATGHHGSCRYPWPHAMWWYIAYHRRERGETHVTMADAWRVWEEINGEENAQIAARMEREPAFRREIRAIDRGTAQSILAARRRLRKKARPAAA